MTIVVAVADKEASHQDLLDFDERDARQLAVGAQSSSKRGDETTQPQDSRMSKFGIHLEFYRPLRRSPDDGAELPRQGVSFDIQGEVLEAGAEVQPQIRMGEEQATDIGRGCLAVGSLLAGAVNGGSLYIKLHRSK